MNTVLNAILPCQRPAVKRALAGMLTAYLILVVSSLASPEARAAEAERLMGRVLDAESGEPLIGFSVYLEGTTKGAQTDLDGNYIIKNVEPGRYTLVVSGLGYKQTKMADLVVSGRDQLTHNFALDRVTVETDSIVVVGKMHRNSAASMLKHRQRADFVGDAISAEDMSKAGGGDAASAMERVVGASVVGGKYVYVRGLGDRYANTQLNGSPLPSPDPDKQAVQMDLIPSGLLDNIVVQKTFTPDKPGNFTGGSVNMTTKDLPDRRTLSFSSTTSYNSIATFDEDMPTYTGGSKDWLGYDDGTRDLPGMLADTGLEVPNINRIRSLLRRTDPDSVAEGKRLAALMDESAEALSPQMTPSRRDVPLNQSHSISYGDLVQFFGQPLGVQGSLTYSRTWSKYENGQANRYKWGAPSQNELQTETGFIDSRGVAETQWGGLLSLAYHFHSRHKIRFDYMHNQSGESTARYMLGENGEQQLTHDQGYYVETRVLEYVERDLTTRQLTGTHDLKLLIPVRAEWQYSSATTDQNEPDRRTFTNHYLVQPNDTGTVDTTYYIAANLYPYPSHLFRTLEETSRDGRMDLLFPFRENQAASGSFKTGFAVSKKDRKFRETGFSIQPRSLLYYNGDADWFFSADNMGLVEAETDLDTTRPVVTAGNTLQKATVPENNYDGQQDIWAVYGMVEFPIFNRLHVITGVRYEHTMMDLVQPFASATKQTQDSLAGGSTLIDEGEWLPSLNLRYPLGDNTNLRAALSRTIARPTIRELAPYSNDEYEGGFIFTGNRSLEYSTINNYDLRWESFTGPGEVLSVSAFYKHMNHPIERAIINDNGEIRPENVEEANVLGVEFEWRQGLGRLTDQLSNFALGGNVTFVRSQVDIPAEELANIRAFEANADDTRPLQGQSPYILNLDLGYTSERLGLQSSLLYNVFGRRFVINGKGGTPDVYEQPRQMLDWNISKQLFGGTRLKFGVENILNEEVEMAHEFRGKKYYYALYETGVTYKIGLSTNL